MSSSSPCFLKMPARCPRSAVAPCQMPRWPMASLSLSAAWAVALSAVSAAITITLLSARLMLSSLRRGVSCVAPHALGHLDDARELPFLVGLRQRIAFDRAGEAALRAQRQLVERRKLRGLVDPPAQPVGAFQQGTLARHEPEHHDLALRQQAQ